MGSDVVVVSYHFGTNYWNQPPPPHLPTHTHKHYQLLSYIQSANAVEIKYSPWDSLKLGRGDKKQDQVAFYSSLFRC